MRIGSLLRDLFSGLNEVVRVFTSDIELPYFGQTSIIVLLTSGLAVTLSAILIFKLVRLFIGG